jgi:predicted ferric reductase
MLFLAVIILVVRRWQISTSRSRMLSTLHLTQQQQRYWSIDHGKVWSTLKRSVISAPLIRTRHNKEFQLSRAIGIGTLPSRFHTILLSTYLICNVIYCCLLDYTGQPKAALVAEIRGRTGHLAVINMVGLFLFAARNNPLIPLLKVSFDTFNLFHRWIGRIVVLESITHMIMWAINKRDALGSKGMIDSLAIDSFAQCGLVSGIAMILILIQTPSPVRHAFYETFLHIHQFLAFATLLGILLHVKIEHLPQIPIVFLIIGIWSSERIARLIRIIYRNISHRGYTRVTVEALEGGACRVGFRVPGKWTHRPGCHIYAYIPGVSLWMSHPFSVAWVDHQDSNGIERPFVDSRNSSVESFEDESKTKPKNTHTMVYCIMATRTGMTCDLFRRAYASPAHIVTIPAFIEGPYGGLESLRSYGTVILFAGGVGITHQLSQLRDLVTSFEAGLCSTRKIRLIWSVRSSKQLEWARKWIEEVLEHRVDEQDVEVLAFVSQKNTSQAEARRTRFPGVITQGRANPKAILQKEFQERVGAMSVGVCGPGAFADDVRAAARMFMPKGSVDFWEEAFTW